MLKSFLYFLRNLRYRKIFYILHKYCTGNVIDIGGWDFCLTAHKIKIPFDHWTVIENDPSHFPKIDISNISIKQMDGCNLFYGDNEFDTSICIQVAEHVFTPQKLFEENVRVLKRVVLEYLWFLKQVIYMGLHFIFKTLLNFGAERFVGKIM